MSRLKRVVYAVGDPKMGCLGGATDLNALPQINHHLEITRGVLAQVAAVAVGWGMIFLEFGQRVPRLKAPPLLLLAPVVISMYLINPALL